MASMEELKATAAQLARRGRGILAADESVGTIGKRLIAQGIQNSEENRRTFREILITSPGNEEAYSGVILFHETLYQKTSDGRSFVDVLNERGILVGIKVDLGLKPVDGSPLETQTVGMDGLRKRCEEYRKAGARFAKWRATLRIDDAKHLPSEHALDSNCTTLAQYAREAHAAGLVPIIEPEILIDGQHSQSTSREVARRVLRRVYSALQGLGVALDATLLKPMMIMSGIAHGARDTTDGGADGIARATLDTMVDEVPAGVRGIMFLSGGMGEAEATRNLNALARLAERERSPWVVSFSFGRALQTSAMKIWNGQAEHIEKAKDMAAALGKANARAQLGEFDGLHPSLQQGKSLYEGFRGWRSGEDPKGA